MFRWPHPQRAGRIDPRISPRRRQYGQKELVAGPGFAETHGRRPRVLSYGGGLDSFCILLSALEAGRPPDRIVFMDVGNPRAHILNVGDDAEPGEWPETYDHILEVVIPLAQEHGIPFHWITSDAPTGTMKRRMSAAGAITEVYPIRPPQSARARLSRPAYGLWEWFLLMSLIATRERKMCTDVAKIERFDEWLADMYPGEQAEVWIGFEKGEEYRATRGKSFALEGKEGGQGRKIYMVQPYVEYPLIDWYDLTREDCAAYVASRGFPVPKKSACMGCIFNKDEEWLEYAERFPKQFAKTVGLERGARTTEAGFPFAQVFTKFGLSRPQYLLMRKLARSPGAAMHGQLNRREERSLDKLVERSWATSDGTLTSDGEAVLKAARRRPPKRGETSTAIVEAAAGVRRDAKGNVTREGRPRAGVHYSTTPLDEWVRELMADPDTRRRLEAMQSERRALLPPGRLTRKLGRNPSCAPIETGVWHMDTFGRPATHRYLVIAYNPETRQDYGHAQFAQVGDEAFVEWFEVRSDCRPGFPLGDVTLRLAEELDSWARRERVRLVPTATTPDGAAFVELLRRTKRGRDAIGA